MTIIYGLLGLSVIIFVHELGHFIAARYCGVEVESFSIGMGPILLHRKIGKTDYRISLIPLGGYCGMKGEKGFQEAIEQKLDSIPAEKDSFYGVSPLRRIIIAFTGPFFNVLFAIISLTIISMIGYNYYTTPSRIILASEVYENVRSVASEAGLQTGDIITSIEGKETKYFSDISEIVTTSPQEELHFTVLRDGEIHQYYITPELDATTGAGRIGIVNWVDTTIKTVNSQSIAEQAGLVSGDIIVEVEGFPVNNTMDFIKIIQNRDSAQLVFNRGEEMHTTTLNLEKNTDGTVDINSLGILWNIEEVSTTTYSFFPALLEGTKDTIELLGLTIKSITLLFRGVDITQAVSGPIGITMMLGETTKNSFEAGFLIGVVNVLNFLSLISISLFIMNLLPIPILDGGIILFSLIELTRGKAVKPTVLYKVQFIGLGFILFLFAIGFIGDISRLIGTP